MCWADRREACTEARPWSCPGRSPQTDVKLELARHECPKVALYVNFQNKTVRYAPCCSLCSVSTVSVTDSFCWRQFPLSLVGPVGGSLLQPQKVIREPRGDKGRRCPCEGAGICKDDLGSAGTRASDPRQESLGEGDKDVNRGTDCEGLCRSHPARPQDRGAVPQCTCLTEVRLSECLQQPLSLRGAP